MGKHRRQRVQDDFKRKKGNRPRFERVLIVTEGTKTEPNYFGEIRKEKRLGNAYIMVVPADGTTPLQVVESAEARFKENREYERVYAVFDRDSHPKASYDNALAKARALDGKLKNSEKQAVAFKAVPSVACFELWLLLHFANEQAYRDRTEIFRALRGHLPGYEKGNADSYAKTKQHLAVATARAVALRVRFTAEAGNEAYTNVDEVVGVLVGMRTA